MNGSNSSKLSRRGLAFFSWILSLTSSLSFGDVTEAWVQRYSNPIGNSMDSAVKVVAAGDGNFFVTGTADDGISGQDILTIKVSGANGSTVWQRRYNGPANLDDAPTAIAVDANGNAVVAGFSYGNGTSGDFYTAKYAAADGRLLWERRYNGPESSYDQANAIAVDSANNIVVTGKIRNGNSITDIYTVKYASDDGSPLWEKIYNGPYNHVDVAYGIAVDSNDDVVITGYSYGPVGGDNFFTAKYRADNGVLLWSQRRGSFEGSDISNGIVVDHDNNVIVTGSRFNGADTDYYTVKYAPDGTFLWDRIYDGPRGGEDAATAVTIVSNGDIVLTGNSWNGTNSDFYTTKYSSADGAILWEKRFDSAALYGDYPQTVIVDDQGDVIVTGFLREENGSDIYTAKYSGADGALIWARRLSGLADRDAAGLSIAFDGTENVVIAGFADNLNNRDYYVAKYHSSDSAVLWENYFDVPANNDDYAQAVAIDNQGNVGVTGSSSNGRNSDYYTAKYSASGGLLWEKRYNGPADRADEATAMAFDEQGNVLVTGFSTTARSDDADNYQTDHYTAKYAATNGALLWEKRYNGPSNGGEKAVDIAADSNGDVIVSGSSTDFDYETESEVSSFYTAKYASADGALIWERRDQQGQVPHDLVLDSLGNAIVTGTSYWDETSVICYTAKYSATDGTVIWGASLTNDWGFDTTVLVATDFTDNIAIIRGSYDGTNYTSFVAKLARQDGHVIWDTPYGAGSMVERANDVAVDSNGNVIVTGYTAVAGTGDIYTAKYAAQNGTSLWERRYNGPANGNDAGLGIAITSGDDAVVTGVSHNGTSFDCYTAKLRSTNGAIVWEKTYNGPADGNDFAFSIAIGTNGSVAIATSSDGLFGSPVAFDFATILYREVLPSLTIERNGSSIRIRSIGDFGSSYKLQRAPTVTGQWETIATLDASIEGNIDYVDINPPQGSAFYRMAER